MWSQMAVQNSAEIWIVEFPLWCNGIRCISGALRMQVPSLAWRRELRIQHCPIGQHRSKLGLRFDPCPWELHMPKGSQKKKKTKENKKYEDCLDIWQFKEFLSIFFCVNDVIILKIHIFKIYILKYLYMNIWHLGLKWSKAVVSGSV